LAIGILAIGIGLPLLRGSRPEADDREAEDDSEAEEELARAA